MKWIRRNKKVYIYALIDPRTNNVRYVGKTINLTYRYKTHLSDRRKTHKTNWINGLLAQRMKPRLAVLEVCYNRNWEQREKYHIQQYANLTNGTLGGEGGTKTEETKKKMRINYIVRQFPESMVGTAQYEILLDQALYHAGLKE